MLKKLTLAVIALSFVFSAQVVSAQQASTPAVDAFLSQLTILRQLQQGMSGEDVKLLQAILASQPDVYPEGLVTGYYGPMTTKAVRKYQEKFGIAQAGRVGPQTMKKVNELLSYNKVMVSGTSTALTYSSTSAVAITAAASGDCVSVPPGHLIAPGWLKKNAKSTVPTAPILLSACQKLPPGIARKLGLAPNIGTTTPPVIPPVVVDTVAPIISTLISSSTSATTTRISWMTNELATTRVVFGTSTPVLSSSATTTPAVVGGYLLTHSVDLGNLSTSTTYYFVAESVDAVGNVATSSQVSFVTPAL